MFRKTIVSVCSLRDHLRLHVISVHVRVETHGLKHIGVVLGLDWDWLLLCSSFLLFSFPGTAIGEPDLDTWFSQSDFLGDCLSHVDVGILSFGKGRFEKIQLFLGETGAVAAPCFEGI